VIGPAEIEAIARRTAELILAQRPPAAEKPWIGVDAKARQLGVSPSLIYRHPTDVGGVKIGDRWRFPPEPPTPPASTPPPQQPRKRRGSNNPPATPLLPIHR